MELNKERFEQMKYRKQHFIDIQLFENTMQLRPIAIYNFLNYMNKNCVSH